MMEPGDSLAAMPYGSGLTASSPVAQRRRSSLARCLTLAALPLALALGLTACSPPDAKDVAKNATLKIAFFNDNPLLLSIDPFQVYWLEHRVVLRNVAESLTDQDPASGKIIPWLAKSWEISDNALEYSFQLRTDISFSNGTPFNAQAVKTAFEANKAFAKAQPATFGATYLDGYSHAEVIDEYRVKLVLERPNAGFLQATSTTNLAILAPESYQRTPKERSLGALIGTGPFVLERYTPEQGIRLVRRSGYAWPSTAASNRGEAHLAAVEVSYVPEASVRNGQFLQGQVHIVWPREPFSEVDLQLLRSKGATIHSRSLPGPAFNLYPNTSKGRVLADAKVRQALQKAINRQSYATTVYSADFPAVQGPYDVTTPYFKSQRDKLAFDPQGAARLLDEAGWRLGEGGYRYHEGKRLSLVYNLRGSETPGDVLLQDQLKQVGIELKLNIQTPGEWAAARAAGQYDLASSYMTRADPIVLQTFLDPRATNRSALSVSAYEPETLVRAQKLFDAGMTASQSAARAQAYAELQDLLIDENVAFPLWERVWQAASSAKVKGFKWTSEGFALLNDIELLP